MELTLKDQSVIEIGNEIADRVGEFQSAGTALVPANQMAPAGAIANDVQPMNPFDSMMVVLQDIRDGIFQLVDKFSEGVSLQNEALEQQEFQDDAAALASTEQELEGGGDEPGGPNMLDKFKEKANLADTSFMGLLVKGGIIATLVGLAQVLQKYGRQIAEALTPIVDGIKEFYGYIVNDIGVLFDDMISFVKDAVTGIFTLFKGLFGGDGVDGELVSEGLAELLTLPTKLVAMVGKFVVALIDDFLQVFGIEAVWLDDIYKFFDDLPGYAKQFYKAVTDFFLVTIPTKISEAEQAVTTFFTDLVTDIKGFFTDIANFFTVDIPKKFNEIVDEITTKFEEIKNTIVDAAMTPFRKIGELFDSMVVGILESLEDIPFIGDKAREMKASFLGEESPANTATMDALVTTTTGADGQVTKQIAAPQTDDMGNILDPRNGDILRVDNQDAAKVIASQLTAAGHGDMVPYYDDGGFFGSEFYGVRKRGANEAGGNDFSLSGQDLQNPNANNQIMTQSPTMGSNLNNDSAEFVNSEMGNPGAFVNTGGNNISNSSSTVQQNYMNENTSTGDAQIKEALN